MRYYKSLLCTVTFLWLIIELCAINYCVQRIENCDGSEIDCSRSVRCHHGECDENGNLCLCEPCWVGTNCNQYVDHYAPKFLTATKFVSITEHDSGVLFSASAFDDDKTKTCEDKLPCPCAQITYTITSGNYDRLFTIDPVNGHVSLSNGKRLTSGEEYHLAIMVSSKEGNTTDNMNPDSNLEVTLRVSHEPQQEFNNFPRQDNLNNEVAIHHISKRSTGSTNETVFTLTQLSPSEDQTTLRIGEKADYKLEITIPVGVMMDLVVEISTADPESEDIAFTICNTVVQENSAKVVEPTLSSSEDLPGIDKNALLNFETVSIGNDATYDEQIITIKFTVVLIDNSPYVTNGNNYSIMAGAAYDNESYIWIGQSPFTANAASTSDNYTSTLSLTGSDTIAVSGYSVYTLKLISMEPMATYSIDIFGNNAPLDSYSSGPVAITSVGSNYPCAPKNLLTYNYELIPSSSEKTKKSTSLKTELIVNCDNTGRTDTTNLDNEILIKFLMYIPDDNLLEESIIPLSATVMINQNKIWANILNITVTAKEAKTTGTLVLNVTSNQVTGHVSGIATVMAVILFEENTCANIIIEALTPETEVNPPVLSICGVKLIPGANIPFTPKVEPETMSRSGGTITDKLVYNLGEVCSSDMIPGNTTARSLLAKIYVRIHDASADGSSMSVKLLATDDSTVASQSVTVKVDQTPASQSTEAAVDIHMINVLNQTDLSVEGETANFISMSFLPDTTLETLTLEVLASMDNETVQARICRAEIAYVSEDVLCVHKRIINNNVQYQKRIEIGDIYDLAKMELGSVCTSKNQPQNSTKGQLAFSFTVELPRQDTAVDGATYTLYSGVKLGTSLIWTGSSVYTISSTPSGHFPDDNLPYINGSLAPNSLVAAGGVALIFIRIKIPPKSSAAYTLTVTADAGQNVGICSLSLAFIGHNFPCVDPNPMPGNTSRLATTRLNYDQHNDILRTYSKAILDFGPLSNTGDDPYSTDDIDDKNTIKVAVTMKLDAAATGDIVLTYDLKYTQQTGSLTNTVTIPVQAAPASPPPAESLNMTFEAYDGTNDINIQIPKIMIFKFQITPEILTPILVTFTGTNDAATRYGFCSAAITRVGRNVPCLNATDVIPTSNDTTSEDNCKNILTMNLQNICRMPMTDNPDDDWVTIEVGMNILDETMTGSVTAMAKVTVGATPYETGPVSLTIYDSPPNTSPQNISLTPVKNTSIPVYIGQRNWVDMNITIPKDAVVSLKLTATGASANNRAIVVITGLKVSATGINVACIKNTTSLDLSVTTSAAVTMTQTDSAFVDFGYVFNTGFTYHGGYPVPHDDKVTISVEVIMTDHPQTDVDKEFPINITIESNTGEFLAGLVLIVARNGTEKPNIQVSADVLGSGIFKPGDTVSMRLLLSHTKQSSAEPTDSAIRLLLPQYMNYSGSLSSNATLSESYDSFVSLMMTTPFLFGEIYEINFTLTVDPYNKRRLGASDTTATTLGRIMGHVTQRTIDGTQYPSTTAYVYAGTMFHFIYKITGKACNSPLGMENGEIKDCQLSASTVTSIQKGPSQARLNGNAGAVWQPALRNNGFLDFLQVDFGNKTKVSQVAVQKDACCRAPTSILLQYGDSGMQWSDGPKVSSLNYSGDTAMVILDVPLETRFLRIVVVDAEQPENKDTKYVGVRGEFYGCTVGHSVPLSDVCGKTASTIDSNDVMQYRHFSVATQNDAIFACDIRTNSWELSCFCSADGSLWKSLPSQVTNIIGYDGVNGLTFAKSSKNTTILRSTDCTTWLASMEQDLQSAIGRGHFVGSSVVPGLAKGDPSMEKTSGTWKATYDGLYKNGVKKLDWSL